MSSNGKKLTLVDKSVTEMKKRQRDGENNDDFPALKRQTRFEGVYSDREFLYWNKNLGDLVKDDTCIFAATDGIQVTQLGFNIRGGKEHFCGIYISKVMPNTEAETLGLREGDQILIANDMNFEDIEHSKAVKTLKSNAEIQLFIRYFPYGYHKTYEKSRIGSGSKEQLE